MKCRYFLYIAELTILDCSATGCNRVRWNLTQSWGRKSHIHWHTCQLTGIDRSVTVCLTVTLYFSQTVCLCFCWLKRGCRCWVLLKQKMKNNNQAFKTNFFWVMCHTPPRRICQKDPPTFKFQSVVHKRPTDVLSWYEIWYKGKFSFNNPLELVKSAKQI